jgi:hypothetical protein
MAASVIADLEVTDPVRFAASDANLVFVDGM